MARQEIIERCRKDGWFWATNYIKTRDEADADAPVKPFPDKAYLRDIWKSFDEHPRIAVAKSRQLMLSWLVCAYCVHTARFQNDRAVYFQTQKADDAHAMVCLPGVEEGGFAARMQFIVRSMPEWMRGTWKESEGKLSCVESGSMIHALAGGANQIRGKTPSLLVEDEYAFQEEAAGVYQAIAPLLQKQTRFIAVSTPNGPDNTFATLVHGGPLLRRESA